MNARSKVGWLVCAAMSLSAPARAEDIPDEARAVLDEYQKSAVVIQAKAETDLGALQRKFIPRLKVLQDKYCRAAKLDDALAVREAIRSLLGIQPDPGAVHAGPQDIGRSSLYWTTGSVDGAVWGGEVYTTDSNLGTAAVHAGVLRAGEKAIVRVRIVAGQKSYLGSTAHGITSQAWGSWTSSFTIERPKDLVGLDL
jgi:LCCL domain-containing protein